MWRRKSARIHGVLTARSSAEIANKWSSLIVRRICVLILLWACAHGVLVPAPVLTSLVSVRSRYQGGQGQQKDDKTEAAKHQERHYIPSHLCLAMQRKQRHLRRFSPWEPARKYAHCCDAWLYWPSAPVDVVMPTVLRRRFGRVQMQVQLILLGYLVGGRLHMPLYPHHGTLQQGDAVPGHGEVLVHLSWLK